MLRAMSSAAVLLDGMRSACNASEKLSLSPGFKNRPDPGRTSSGATVRLSLVSQSLSIAKRAVMSLARLAGLWLCSAPLMPCSTTPSGADSGSSIATAAEAAPTRSFGQSAVPEWEGMLTSRYLLLGVQLAASVDVLRVGVIRI